MDMAFFGLIATDILCALAILFMIYNRIRWKDELHGVFEDRAENGDENA